MRRKKIIKLLKSPNTEDKIIGINLAVDILGERWCRSNFTDIDKYPSNDKIVLIYSNFKIFIGSDYIEYWDPKMTRISPEERFTGFDDLKIINYTTNDTDEELSESTQ